MVVKLLKMWKHKTGTLIVLFVLFTVYTNVQSALNQEVAMNTVSEIIKAENKTKVSGGRYVSLQELHQSGLTKADYGTSSYYGFRYRVQFNDQSLIVSAEPLLYGVSGYWATGRFRVCLDQNNEPCS